MLKKIINYSVFPFESLKAFLKILISKTQKNKLVNKDITFNWDGQLFHGNPTGDVLVEKLFLRGFNEFAVTQWFDKYIKEDMVVVDVGAHMGWSTLMMAKRVGSNGKVFAFEPSDYYRKMLMKNIEVNRYSNIVVRDTALYSENGIKYFRLENGTVADQKSDNTIEVNCEKFDTLQSELKLNQIDLIKIDIEGAELSCLLGMEEVLNKYKPILIIEVHTQYLKQRGHSSRKLIEFLEKKSYDIRPFDVSKNEMLTTDQFCYHLIAF